MGKVEKIIVFFISIIIMMISPIITAILVSIIIFIMLLNIHNQNNILIKQNEHIIQMSESKLKGLNLDE